MVSEGVDVAAQRAPINAFEMPRAAASRFHLLLPPPRATTDNTDDDKLFNDLRGWLEENGVGWPRNEVGSFRHPRPAVFEPDNHCILSTHE